MVLVGLSANLPDGKVNRDVFWTLKNYIQTMNNTGMILTHSHYNKENTKIVSYIKRAKRCSALLISREKQVKVTMRCHLTPIGMATIKITGVGGDLMKLGPLYLECNNGPGTRKQYGGFSEN